MTARVLLCFVLDLFHHSEHWVVQRVVWHQASELVGSNRRGRFLEDLGQLHTLLVAWNVLEAESLFQSIQQSFEFLAALSKLRGRSNESLLPRNLAHRGPTDTLNTVLQVRVRDTVDDRLDILHLFLLLDSMLDNNETGSLSQYGADGGAKSLISKRLGDHLLASGVAIIGGSGMAGVDGEELAFNVGLQVVYPVDGINIRMAHEAKRTLFDNPFVELLDADIEAIIGRLVGDNAVNCGIGELGTLGKGFDTINRSIVLNVAMKSVGGTDGILTSDHSYGLDTGASIDAFGNDRGDELEDVRANGAGHNIGSRDLLYNVLLVSLGVDGTVVGDGLRDLTLLADFGNLVGRGVVKGRDDIVHDVDEDNLVRSFMEKPSDETTADVTTTELDGFLSHGDDGLGSGGRW